MSTENIIRPPYVVNAGPFPGVYRSRAAYEQYAGISRPEDSHMDSRPVGLDRRNPPPEETRRGRELERRVVSAPGAAIHVEVGTIPDDIQRGIADGLEYAIDQQRRRDFARTVWLCCVLAAGMIWVIVALLGGR